MDDLKSLPAATPWPNLNARLLSVAAGLPIHPLDRLALFQPDDFERLVLEWAKDYLSKQEGIYEVQLRGGSGDKGRDVVTWLDPSDVVPRRFKIYQCKRYSDPIGADVAAVEVGKVIHFTARGDYPMPIEYWFVTTKGVSGTLQDLLDEPEKLKRFVLKNWDKYCAKAISSKAPTQLDSILADYINQFDFSIFKAKQPHDLIDEYKQTPNYLKVFGAPLIDRPPPPTPPSTVAPSENRYISELFDVIGEVQGTVITAIRDFLQNTKMLQLFDRSRITFYSAEGLKELGRDRMADPGYFDALLLNFADGLYHTYTVDGLSGLQRLQKTVQAAQLLPLEGLALGPYATANDREGICHHLANEGKVQWRLK